MSNLVVGFNDGLVTIEELLQFFNILALSGKTIHFNVDILEVEQAIEVYDILISKGYRVEFWYDEDEDEFSYSVIYDDAFQKFLSYKEINELPFSPKFYLVNFIKSCIKVGSDSGLNVEDDLIESLQDNTNINAKGAKQIAVSILQVYKMGVEKGKE